MRRGSWDGRCSSESASAQLWKEESGGGRFGGGEACRKGGQRRDLFVGLGLEISQREKHCCSGCVLVDFCVTEN